jgi:chaperonin GroES
VGLPGRCRRDVSHYLPSDWVAEQGEKFMKIRPLHDRVIIKRLEEERKTASGIVIPDTAAEKPDQGEVISVGNGKVLEDGSVRKLEVKPGDRVLFGKYSGQTVKVEGEELLVMREEDIMGVVEK